MIGNVDYISSTIACGWCVRPKGQANPAEVVAMIGDKVVGEAVCDTPRADISVLYPKSTKQGFTLNLNWSGLESADEKFNLRFIEKSSGRELKISTNAIQDDCLSIEIPKWLVDRLLTHELLSTAMRSNTAELLRLNRDPRVRLKIDPSLARGWVINGVEGTGSERYRVDNLVRTLADSGYQPAVFSVADSGYLNIDDMSPRPEFIYFVRCSMSVAEIRSLVRKSRFYDIPIFADFDDLVFDPEIIYNISGYNELDRSDQILYEDGVHGYREILRHVNAASFSTSHLSQKAEGITRRSIVLRNRVPRYKEPEIRAKNEQFTIGYYSGTNTHNADFARVSHAIASVLARTNSRLRIVGMLDISRFPELPEGSVETAPFVTFDAMLEDMSACDVVICPLEVGDEFCESKSEIKFLESAIVKVPIIASATGTYKDVINHGDTGYLARSSADWQNILLSLYEDRYEAQKVGDRAHVYVMNNCLASEDSPLLTELFQGEGIASARLPDSGQCRRYASTCMSSPKESVNSVRVSANVPSSKRLAVLLPDISVGSGGIRKVLTFCSRYCSLGGSVEVLFKSDRSSAELARIVEKVYFPRCGRVRAYQGAEPKADVVVATSWPTAYDVQKWDCAEKFYFIQDFEAMFSPMSTHYIKAFNSYNLGLKPIAFGKWNSQKLLKEFGIHANSIPFPVDKSVYFPIEENDSRQKKILFYARPSQPRRLFELGHDAVKLVRSFVPEFSFAYFGEPIELTIQGVDCLGQISNIRRLAALYRESSFGIAFSTTNPSLMPFEMLACGLPVIDVDLGGEMNDFDGCEAYIRVRPEEVSIARAIIDLANDREKLRYLQQSASSWAKGLPTDEQFADAVISELGLFAI